MSDDERPKRVMVFINRDPFSARPVTPEEAQETGVIDPDGNEVPLFVVTCDGEDVSGPLTASYIKRLFGFDFEVPA